MDNCLTTPGPVKINPLIFQEPEWNLYDSSGNLVGTIDNVLTFNDVRLQIKDQNLSGYCLVNPSTGFKLEIAPNGQIADWPADLFPLLDEQLEKLLLW
jgi:hypothetical protein